MGMVLVGVLLPELLVRNDENGNIEQLVLESLMP